MRTKHILISMALGAAFVSCSQEELIAPENGAVNDAKLGIRPVVDTQITLGGEANTRLVLGSAFRPAWSTNDKVGAAIIDTPSYTDLADYNSRLRNTTSYPHGAIDLYTINEWYGCNNAFSTTDGGTTWAAEHPMVEGNYLFYAPYSETMNVRTPLVVAVPRQQDASSAKSALTEFYTSGSVVEVGYKFITGADKQTPTNIKMFNIFAYPKFTIKNNFDGYLFNSTGSGDAASAAYSGDIKIDSIQFVNVDNTQAAKTMQIGGQLKHANAASATGCDATAGVVGKMKPAGAWNDVDELLSAAQTTDLLNTTSNQISNGRHNMSGVITTLVVGQTIAKGGSIDVYCVMPAAKFNFTSNQLLAKIYATINGVGYEIYQATFASPGNVDSWTIDKVKLAADADKPGKLFGANGNSGLSSLSFMAGQAYPSEALRVDADGNYQKKTGVNNLLEINLVGGKAKKGATQNVQIAVRMGSTNSGYATTASLIEAIENAANGTKWVEGATSSAAAKGFKIAASNTVEINSALVDALAKNNQNGGSFKLMTSVLPVANDVKLKAVVKTAGSASATFVSTNGNEATVKFDDAIVVTGAATAADKYALGASATAFNSKSVVLIAENENLALSEDTEVRSLVVGPAITSGSTKGIVTNTSYKLTAVNINNYGTLKVKDVKALDILNKGSMEVSGGISAPTGRSLTFTNNGTITTKNIAANFVVTAGTGKIVLPEQSASSAALVGTSANQEVIYDANTAVATSQITKAAAIPNVTSIRANGAITLHKDDIAKFGAIRKIYATTAGVSATDLETYDLTGFTLVLNGSATWTGTNVNQSIVKGLTVNVNSSYALTLRTVSFTEATLTGTRYVGSGISADGITAKWNGGASALLE